MSANTSGGVPTLENTGANTYRASANAQLAVPTLEDESANAPTEVPTVGANTLNEVPTVSANAPTAVPTLESDLPAELAGSEMEEIDLANATVEVPTRLEPRYNEHGRLRGIAWRERNKDRRSVYYVGAKSEGQKRVQWLELKPKFDKE